VSAPDGTGTARDWAPLDGQPLIEVIDDLIRERGDAADWEMFDRSPEPPPNLPAWIDPTKIRAKNVERLKTIGPLLTELGRGENLTVIAFTGSASEGFSTFSVPALFWRIGSWVIRRARQPLARERPGT
jgi:hypothetical protein